MIGAGIGLTDVATRRRISSGLDPIVEGYITRRTYPMLQADRDDLNWLVGGLRSMGAVDWLDTLYLPADNEADAKLNVIADSFPLVPINGPVFTPYRGWQGDGIAAQLASGYTIGAAGTKYALNNATILIGVETPDAAAVSVFMGEVASGAQRTGVSRSLNTNTLTVRLTNAGNSVDVSDASNAPVYLMSRTAAGSFYVFSGSSTKTVSSAAMGIRNNEVRWLQSQQAQFYGGRLAFFGMGSGLPQSVLANAGYRFANYKDVVTSR